MIFGHDKYVKIEGFINQYPLPNALIDTSQIPHTHWELKKYNVYAKLFKQDLNYKKLGFNHDTIDNLIKYNKKFVYPILMASPQTFKDISDDSLYKIPQKVIKAIKNGKSKILLSYLFEGDFYKFEDIKAINKFVEKYSLTKKDVLFVTNNLKHKYSEPEHINFTLITYNYFLTNPWFTKEDFLDENNNIESGIRLQEKLDYLKTYEKPKKFLSLNRRPRLHRVLLFTEIMKDDTLRENTIISLGRKNLEFLETSIYSSWAECYKFKIEEDYKYNKELGINFLEHYDNSKDHFVDSNLEYNLAFNFNETLHLNTFVNVLTETLHENETIFLSEKIFKPIMGCQPFIVFGNPNILRELQRMGFKTFSKFWDESYDSELNLSKRLEKIITILKELSKKSNQELLEITKQMLPILQHNYNHIKFAAQNEVWQLKQTLDEQFKII